MQSDEEYQRMMLDTLEGLKSLRDRPLTEEPRPKPVDLMKTLEAMGKPKAKRKAAKRKG